MTKNVKTHTHTHQKKKEKKAPITGNSQRIYLTIFGSLFPAENKNQNKTKQKTILKDVGSVPSK